MKVFSNLNLTQLQQIMLIASSKRFLNMQRQCWANAQYSRRECVEIEGITTSVPDELEETFCKIVEKFGIKNNDREIESCYRAGTQGRTIVKFTHRKNCRQLMKVRKDLCKLNLTDIDLGNSKVFINQSLCPNCKL